jgi:release factor glutamine methyltransferase
VQLVIPPGVYAPNDDSRLLSSILREQDLGPATSVLDVCTGSGYLAICASLLGAGHVTAIDASRRATAAAAHNARRNGARVSVLRGDLLEPVAGAHFDLIVSNPPYVPADSDALPRRGAARAWDAGRDGRALLDRLCADGPGLLKPGGRMLLVHSELCGSEITATALQEEGLDVDVIARRTIPFGPVMHQRADELRERGLMDGEQREEEILVVEGRRVYGPPVAEPLAA